MLGGRHSFLFAVALCLATTPAGAQTAPVLTVDQFQSTAELMAGVSLQAPPDVNQRPACDRLALPCLSPRTFGDGGLALSVGINATRTIAVVGELSGYWNHWWAQSDPDCDSAHSTCSAARTNHVRAALAGVRIRTPLIHDGSSRGRIFAQALAGQQWSDVVPRRTVLQPGVGFDGYLQNGIIVRFEIDYRFAPDEVRDLSTDRVLLGIGIPVGLR